MSTIRPILLLTLMLVAVSTVSGAGRFPWLTDLDEAREIAAGQGKPLLVVFRCLRWQYTLVRNDRLSNVARSIAQHQD